MPTYVGEFNQLAPPPITARRRCYRRQNIRAGRSRSYRNHVLRAKYPRAERLQPGAFFYVGKRYRIHAERILP